MKKGITPVIAIILLLLITVAAAGALYFWFNHSQQDVASSAQTGMDKQVEQSSYRMNIESAWSPLSSGSPTTKICMSLRNTGTEDYSETELNNTALYVNGTLVDWDYLSYASGGLAAESSVSVCVCNGTVSGACSATSLVFQYAASDGVYPTVPLKVSPSKGTGSTQNYKYAG